MADHAFLEPRVDIVVVTYRSGDVLETFLDSVGDSPEAASVTVVDSASGDRSAETIAKRRRARFVGFTDNRGYGAAANAGAALGVAPWVALCNPDIVFSPGAIGVLVEAGEESEDIGAVGPLILDDDREVYPSARPLPSMGIGIGHATLGRVWPRNPWTRRYRRGLDPAAGPVDVGWLSGSCLVVRRTAFEEVGGFDEGFFMFMEDVDLGRRLGEAGFQSRWVPDASVVHTGGHSWRSDPEPMIRAHHDSVGRYLSVAYPGPLYAPLRGVAKVGLRIRETIEVAASRRAKAD
jgi:N-acetylglucosaminyl-diphospho-decaprenol L-rhamnosyltransferase